MNLFRIFCIALTSSKVVTAFGSFGSKKAAKPVNKVAASFSQKTIVVEDLPGVLPPIGFFDPLNFAGRASDNLIRKYREAELTHGRIAMIASLGFLVNEAVSGKTPLFEGKITGSGLTMLDKLPGPLVVSFVAGAFAIETYRSQRAIVDPVSGPPELQSLYRSDYIPGDLGFDPLGLKPQDPEEFKVKQTKELQNGRLAMIAASGFLAQELVDKKGIVEHIIDLLPPLPELPF